MEKIRPVRYPHKALEIVKNPRVYGGLPDGTSHLVRRSAYKGIPRIYEIDKKLLRIKLFIARTALSFSCEDLSYLSRVSCPAIRKIEKGNSNVRMNTLYKLCYAMKVHPKIFMIDLNDLDAHPENSRLKQSSFRKFLPKDNIYINKQLKKVRELYLKRGVARCGTYFDTLIKREPYRSNSWTAIVGAIIGMYVGGDKDPYNFYYGAYLSVKLFNELYQQR
jgi:transcriptional regulator with XRE-family HTH domain